MIKKLMMFVVAAMAATGAWATGEKSVVLGDWYEALSDNEATTCARWDDFWMGANVAIPVTGLSTPISASDVVVTAGTYSEFGTPIVLSESEMWNRYGAPVLEQKNFGNVEFDWYDNVWQNWDAEEDGAYGYELSADIWPDWTQVSGRQWILIPTGVPRLGTHTFSVKINGVEHDNYVVSFVMAEDQEPEPYGCQVSFNPNGGEVVEDNREVVAGKFVGTLPAPTRSKYKFLGWYTEPEGGTKVSATTKVTGDVTYYAQWVYDGSATVSANVFNDCKDMGKVTGGKMAKAGTKVTLKATANKGYVFAGWFEYNEDGDHVPCDSSETDYRNPSYAYTVGEDDKTFYAMFKPAEDDDVLMLLVNDGTEDSWIDPDEEELETFTVEGEQHLKLTVLSASLPKVSVKGLPSGMKFTGKPVYKKGSKTEIEYPANTIYGTPTKPGVYKVSVSLTNASIKKAIVCEFEIFVPNFVSDAFPGLSPDPDEYCFEAGTGISSWSIDCAASSDDWKVTVSGLPAGLKWDAGEQGIVGVPTKPGVYTVTFTAKRGKETEVATITMNIEALPAAAYGSFNGFVTREDGLFNKVGSFQMTVSDVGKISAKVVTAAGSYSYSATGWTVDGSTPYRVAMMSKKGDWVDLYLQTDVAWNGDQITGSFFDAEGNEYVITAQKTVFGEPWYFKAKSNDGNWVLVRIWDKKAADITVTVKDGTTKLAGKIDGMSVNSSGFVNMSDFAAGCMKASFTPVVTVNKVKKVLVVDAELSFDSSVIECGMAGLNE